MYRIRFCCAALILYLNINLNLHAQKVSVGNGCALYICSGDSIVAIGNNEYGQLGDGTYLNRFSPVKVIGLPENIMAVDALGSLALDSAGNVWNWSTSDVLSSQLGYSVPNIIIGNVREIISGFTTTGMFYGALKSDSTLWFWGYRLVNESAWWGYNDSIKEVELPKVIKVAGGYHCVIAMTVNGNVWTWGDAVISGNPGYNTVTADQAIHMPQLVNGISDVVDIAAGNSTVFALKKDGTVWAWGSLANTTGNTPPPQALKISNVKSIYAGSTFNSNILYAIKSDGTLWTCTDSVGSSSSSSILYGIPSVAPKMVSIPGKIEFAATAGQGDGLQSSFAVDSLSNIYRWGDNSAGQLGNLTTYPIDSPILMTNSCLDVNCKSILSKDYNLVDTFVYYGSVDTLTATQGSGYCWYISNTGNEFSTQQKTIVTFKSSDTCRYTAIITDVQGCLYEKQYLLEKKCNPTAHLYPELIMDTITYQDNPIQLKAPTDSICTWKPTEYLSCSVCRIDTATVPVGSVSYYGTLLDSLACPYTDKFVISIIKCDTVPWGFLYDQLDTTIHITTDLTLYATKSIYGYKWSPLTGLDCDTCQNPQVIANRTISYTVVIEDQWHCPHKEIFHITMNDSSLIIPNVITPNNDNKNDYFFIKGFIGNGSLRIYDNKGMEVYFKENYDNSWDGRDSKGRALDEGTYWYLLTTQYSGTYKGWVYIKR